MAKDFITAVVYYKDRVEWACISREKGIAGSSTNGSFVIPEPDKEGEIKRKPIDVSGIKGDVSLCLSGESVLLKVLTLPSSNNEEIRSMAELQIDKLSPFPIESMVSSCEVLRKSDNEARVLLAAVRQDMVQQAGDALEKLGVKSVRVDATSLGWCAVLRNAKIIPAEGRHVFVIFNGEMPEIIMFQDGLPALFRTISGVEGMEQALMEDDIASEVANTLMSAELELGSVDNVVITLLSGGNTSDSLVDMIQARCMCEVAVRSLDGLQALAEGAAQRHLALSQTKDPCMDLTPAAWKDRGASLDLKKKIINYSLAAIGLWVVLVGGFALDFFYQKYRLASLCSERDALKPTYLEVKEMRNKVLTITRYMERKYSALECFREICTVQPEGVELNSFSYRKTEEISIAGNAQDVTQVYTFKEKLDTGGFFKESVLTGPIKNKDREDFKIVIKLAAGDIK